MYLYLIRHGEAKNKEDDPERGLSDIGTKNAKKAGVFLRQLKCKALLILHSGKKRAEQTARILVESIGQKIPVKKFEGLAPSDNISIIKEEIEKVRQDSIVIVGHLPHLSMLASDLLTGDQCREIISFRNLGIICLAGENQNWRLEWMVTPDILT